MLILASGSPRRKEILEKLGFEFKTEKTNADESVPDNMPVAQIAEHLARVKAETSLKHNKADTIIGSDTIVVLDGSVLGKPQNEEDAKDMLCALSGNTHKVYTGVCVASMSLIESFTVETDVTFGELSQEEIERYVASGEPMDKAGAYGIQGLGCRFVKSINGDYYAVMGLPANKLYEVLKKFNLEGNICSQEI